MKKIYFSVLFIILHFSLMSQNVKNISLDFKAKLISLGIDSNQDGEIQTLEAEAVNTLSLANSRLTSLEGISAFVNLDTLYCQNNSLRELNVTRNKRLRYLNCANNLISVFNVAGCAKLEYLNCSRNFLPFLSVVSCASLKYLYCNSNKITALGTQNPLLEELNCGENQIIRLSVVSCYNLKTLICSHNQINRLNLYDCPELQQLDCSFNQLRNISLLTCYALQKISCQYNQLLSLDVGVASNLSVIDCSHNQLISLFLKNENRATTLDFSDNINLQYICVDESELDSIAQKCLEYGNLTAKISSACTIFFMNEQKFKVYPNPASTFLTIEVPATSYLAIYNENGQKVMQVTVNGRQNVDISHLKVGKYFIKDKYSLKDTGIQFLKM